MPALTLLLRQGMWLPASCRPSIAVEKVRGLLGALGVGETNGDGWVTNSGGTAIPRLVYLFTVVLLLFLFSDVLELLVFRAATCSRCKRI